MGGDMKCSNLLTSVLSVLPASMDLTETRTSGTVTKDARTLGLTHEALTKILMSEGQTKGGFLDMHELQDILNTHLKLHLSEDDLRETMKIYDTNGDGKLSVEEFLSDVENHSKPDKYKMTHLTVNLMRQNGHARTDYQHMLRMLERAHNITTPCLWIHGDKDRMNSRRAVQPFFDALGPTYVTSPAFGDLRHGIYLDKDVSKVRDAVFEWL